MQDGSSDKPVVSQFFGTVHAFINAGLPPGQKNPGAHSTTSAGLIDPAAHPRPGAAVHALLQAGVESPCAAPKYPAGQGKGAVEPSGQ